MFTDLKIAAGRRPLTKTESRITFALGAAFTIAIFAAVVEEYSPRNSSLFFMLLFWVPMLAVHELGHAVVAKLLGWRVREIVIGFGRDLWQWQLGETRITIKLAPVEGYVLPAPQQPEHVRLKSALIYAAGPGAELLLLAIVVAIVGWDTVFGQSDETVRIALKSFAVVTLFGAGFNLIPFRTDGAVSDGLGILSSPFLPEEAIQWRLMTFELRESQRLLDTGRSSEAVLLLDGLVRRYPGNEGLQIMWCSALAANREWERARRLVQEKLVSSTTSSSMRSWLRLQAEIELDANEPVYLTLDLAVQKALKLTPGAADLLAIKGASLVRRNQYELGGNMLADAWRESAGGDFDAMMLAYLAIAADRIGNAEAYDHFFTTFERLGAPASLHETVQQMTGSAR